jgi:hypothetical protein
MTQLQLRKQQEAQVLQGSSSSWDGKADATSTTQ